MLQCTENNLATVPLYLFLRFLDDWWIWSYICVSYGINIMVNCSKGYIVLVAQTVFLISVWRVGSIYV